MRKAKRRKKLKILLIVLLVLIAPILISKIQKNKVEFNPKDKLGLIENKIIEDQKSNFDVLILVNKNNKLPDDYSVDLTVYNNYKVAKVLLDDLKDMSNAALKRNISLEINTSYRTKSEQQKIFDDTVSQYVKEGSSYNVAVEKTKKTVALPQYSEHETGLAIDFTNSRSYDKRLELWNWLEANAYRYGFILRYPKGKENITGFDYEPWHYRYVGKECAKIMYENNLCLEEYLNV